MVRANQLVDFLCEFDNDDFDLQDVSYHILNAAVDGDSHYRLYFDKEEQDVSNKIIDYFENLEYDVHNMLDPSKKFYNIVTISW